MFKKKAHFGLLMGAKGTTFGGFMGIYRCEKTTFRVVSAEKVWCVSVTFREPRKV